MPESSLGFYRGYRIIENAYMLMDKRVVRTFKERLFSWAPWKKYRTIQIPANYFYILNGEGNNPTIVAHLQYAKELIEECRTKNITSGLNLGWRTPNLMNYNVI